MENELDFRHPTQRTEPSLIADAEINLDSTRAFQGCVQSGISMVNLNADGTDGAKVDFLHRGWMASTALDWHDHT